MVASFTEKKEMTVASYLAYATEMSVLQMMSSSPT